MTDCDITSDMRYLPGFHDDFAKMLKYTIYRAISESDDAKQTQKILVPVASSSGNSSSSRARSRSGTVRSYGKTNEVQQAVAFKIQQAMDNIVTELELMEQAMYLQIDPHMATPPGHPWFMEWHNMTVEVRVQFVLLFQKKSKKLRTWTALLQDLEQKGWSDKQDLQCVTVIHNDVTRWVYQLESKVDNENLVAFTYGNLLYKCSRSISKLTSPDIVRVINISPFDQLKFEMRAIFWAMISICEQFDQELRELEDRDSGSD